MSLFERDDVRASQWNITMARSSVTNSIRIRTSEFQLSSTTGDGSNSSASSGTEHSIRAVLLWPSREGRAPPFATILGPAWSGGGAGGLRRGEGGHRSRRRHVKRFNDPIVVRKWKESLVQAGGRASGRSSTGGGGCPNGPTAGRVQLQQWEFRTSCDRRVFFYFFSFAFFFSFFPTMGTARGLLQLCQNIFGLLQYPYGFPSQ